MWTEYGGIGERLIQFGIMAMVIMGSQAIGRRAQDRRARREADRIRAGLRLSLRALRELYDGNLTILAARSGPLLSGRHQIHLLRIQLGRLVALEQAEIEAVLAASIAMEAAEAAMAVAGRAAAAGAAFVLPPKPGVGEPLKLPLLRACSALELAEARLAPPAVEPEEAPAVAGTAVMPGLAAAD